MPRSRPIHFLFFFAVISMVGQCDVGVAELSEAFHTPPPFFFFFFGRRGAIHIHIIAQLALPRGACACFDEFFFARQGNPSGTDPTHVLGRKLLEICLGPFPPQRKFAKSVFYCIFCCFSLGYTVRCGRKKQRKEIWVRLALAQVNRMPQTSKGNSRGEANGVPVCT